VLLHPAAQFPYTIADLGMRSSVRFVHKLSCSFDSSFLACLHCKFETDASMFILFFTTTTTTEVLLHQLYHVKDILYMHD
jgi:hypothetical protein